MGGITEEKIRLIVEAETAKAIKALSETSKKEQELEKIARETAARRTSIEQDFARKVAALGETRVAGVRREYKEMLAEAEKAGAKRADIEKYYAAQIATARKDSIISGADQAVSFGNKLSLGVTAPLIAAAGAGLKFAASIETQRTRFGVLFGSVEKGNKVLEDLRELGAETPLELGDLTGATQTLAGFQAIGDDLKGTLRMLGDLAMGDAEKMNSLTRAFGQMSAAGVANMEDINKVIDAGVPILDALKKKLGVETIAEVKKAVEQGKVSSDMVKGAFQDLTAEGGLFHDMMKKISETAEGKLSTAMDNVKNAGASAMESLLPLVIDILEGVSDAAERFAALDEGSKKAILTLLGIGAAIGPITSVTGSVVKLCAQLSKMKAIQSIVSSGVLGPIGIATAGVTALAIGIAAAGNAQKRYYEELKETALKQDESAKAARSLGKEYADLTAKKNKSATEELRLIDLGEQIRKSYPGITAEVLNRAIAEGKLAEVLERSANAEGEKAYQKTVGNYVSQIDQARSNILQAVDLMNKQQENGVTVKDEGQAGDTFRWAKAELEKYGLEKRKLEAELRKFQEDHDAQLKPVAITPTPAAAPSGSDQVKESMATRLAALDSLYKKEIEIAKAAGQSETEVEKKHYQERMALLKTFADEQYAKTKDVGKALAVDVDGKGAYKTILEEYQASLAELERLGLKGEKGIGELFTEASSAYKKGKEELSNRIAAGIVNDKDADAARLQLSKSFTDVIGAVDLSKLTEEQAAYFKGVREELYRLTAEAEAAKDPLIDWSQEVASARDALRTDNIGKTVFDSVMASIAELEKAAPENRMQELVRLATTDGKANAFDELALSLSTAGLKGEEVIPVLKEIAEKFKKADSEAESLQDALAGIGGTFGQLSSAAVKLGDALAKAFDIEFPAGLTKDLLDFIKKNQAGLSAVSSSVESLYSTWTDAANDSANASLKAQISALEDQLDELESTSDDQISMMDENGADTISIQIRTKNEKAKLEEEIAKKEDQLARKQFEQEKKNKLVEIAMATAVGAAQALPNFLLMGLVAAAGAAEAAIVSQQKYTALYDGGIIQGSTNGTVIAGERGQSELILPLRQEKLKELGIGQGGNSYQLNIASSASTSREQALEIVQHLKQFEREGRI